MPNLYWASDSKRLSAALKRKQAFAFFFFTFFHFEKIFFLIFF